MERTIDVFPYKSEGVSTEDITRLKQWTGSTEDMERLTELPYSVLIHIKENEHIRGVAMVHETAIMILAVDPAHRRQGYAKAMVDYMKSVCPYLICGIHPSNRQAWEFWKSQDFHLDEPTFQIHWRGNDGALLTFIWKGHPDPPCNLNRLTYKLIKLVFWDAIYAIIAFALAWIVVYVMNQ